ncbi:MAG: hypothetical protein AAF616_16000 [Bacteroidota bacterium]
MKNHFTSLLTFLLCFSSCMDQDEAIAYQQRYQEFDGKYLIVSAESDLAVDLNMDSIPSKNLMDELDEFLESQITISIYEDAYFFTEHWPIEYISCYQNQFDSSRYQSSYSIAYARYALSNEFEFNSDQSALNLIGAEPVRDPNTGSVDQRFAIPIIINVEAENMLSVVTDRYLFTMDGYKKVRITAQYERVVSN